MKRGRVATRGSTRRALRRKNVVVDEEDEDEAEDASQGEEEEEEAEEEEEEKTPPPKLTRAQAKKQEAEAKKNKKSTQKKAKTKKETDEDDEEQEEDEAEDDEDEDEEEEEEADVEERRRGVRGRGGRKRQLRGSKPPPRKKQKRKIIDSEDEEEADEEEDEDDEEEEEAEEGTEEDDDEDDEEEEEEVEEVKPRTRKMRKEESKTTPRGKTRAKTAPTEKKAPPEKKQPMKRRQAPKKIEESAESEDENDEEKEEQDDATSETKEEKPSSDPPSAAATPSSSPAKRKGLSINTLMNDADEEDDQEEQEDVDMTPASASASDTGTDADEVPDQHFREALSGATTEPKLMEVLTEACGRLIRESKSPSRLFAVALLGAVKEDPKRFSQPVVLKYLLRLLRSKHYAGMKDPSDHGKKPTAVTALGSGHLSGSTEYFQISLPVLVTNLLVQVMKDVDEWPVDSVKVFLDDSLSSRVWVDHELSQLFVQNVKTVLETDGSEKQATQPLVRKRFQGATVVQEMRDLITHHVRSRLVELEKEKPGSIGGSSGIGGNHAVRNMIMTLADCASIAQVRVFGAENMEAWLQNPSVKGQAKDLLNKIVALCKSTSPQDIATVDLLLKLKLKSTMFQLKVEAITHLVCNNPVYLKRALSIFIARERPNNMSRDVDNIKMLQHIFRASRSMSASSILGSPDDLFYRRPIEHQGTLASRELARVFREMASVTEVAPVLKTIVRKILKQLTFEQVDIKALCVGILDNDGHWDALAGDARVLDYMGLVTGVVWLILLMRGAAVKSLQIQQSNANNRQGTGSTPLGSTGLKHGGTQAIPRRGSNPPLPVSRANRLGPQKGKQSLGKSSLSSGHTSIGSGGGASGGHGPSGSGSGNGTGASSEGSKTVKISVWAKEELQQALAFVQREAIVCCRDVLKHFGLNGDSPFEKMLYESIVKKLLFLDIPSDVQPTEHDRTCFQSTKEDIPVHEDSLELLTSLYNSCRAIDRVEALRTLETIVFRGAEAHMHREALWRHHEDDLAAYAQNGGVLGIEVKNNQFVQNLLKLALWQGTDDKQEQEFCHSSRFWICCSILLIVGCFNPNTIGTFLWEEFPTLRGLMQMVITGRYTFPAISALDPLLLGNHRAAFPDLIQGNLQLREYEQQLLQLNQGDPSVTGDPLMLFDANGLARQPPPAILEHLRTLDHKFKLGMRLRQSRKKDFLMEMVAGNDDKNAVQNAGAAANSAWWIADIVCEDFDTVQYLPYGCLCQLLLLAVRPSSKNRSDSQAQVPLNQPALAQIIPRLLTKLREYLAGGNDNSDVAPNVVLYYLECLNSPELSTRRVAAHILYLLTAPRSVEELSEEIHQVVGAESAQSFSWLRELAKLPCYSSIRSKIFRSLENLLELEASIPSLRMCMKALNDFSKHGNNAATEPGDIKKDEERNHPKKSAIEQSLLLSGAYGRLLAGRDLVATLLLKDRDIFAITVEVIWRAIESQLEIAPQLKATSGISFSDCKVFYVTDGANTIREIKLPLAIIHGAIQVLCSPHAHTDPSTTASSDNNRTATCLARLTQSLFPRATSNAVILSSTGLVATKDSRLYPDHFLAKLAAAASSTTSHLCATAVRAMSMESLWNLLEQSALSEQCLEMALLAAVETTKKNESKAVASLLAVTKAADISVAADTVLMELSAYDMINSLSPGVLEKLKLLREWLQERSRSKSNMVTDEEDEEALLLSEGFTAFKIQTSASSITPSTGSFYTEPMEESARKSTTSRLESTKTDLEVFKDAYFGHKGDGAAAVDSAPLLEGVVKELKRSSSTGSLPNVIAPEDFVYAASQAVRRSCPKRDDSVTHSPADLWSLHMSLLHFAGSSCNSDAAAAQLAKALLLVVGHLPTCSSAAHRKECSGFVRRALDNLGEGFAGSYSASVSFIRHLAQASTTEGLFVLEDLTVAFDVFTVLQLVVQFIDRTVAQWKVQGVSLRLDAMALHSLVVLVKEVEVLQRLQKGKNAGKTTESCAIDLLASIAHDQADDTTMLNLLDPIMTADPHLGNLGDVVAIHGDVKRELIGALYFQNPKVVAGLLDMLNPDWESLVNFDLSGDQQHELVIRDRRLLSQVDDILRDLTRDGSEVVERFRELTRCHPMLVLSRFPRQLMQHFGTVSLSQLYLNTTFFQNIMCAMQIMRPHMRHRQSVLEPFCHFLFDILRVIADHHAVEFHQLVSHTWEFFYDALETDFDLASELIFSAPRVILLDSIVNMYESQPETVAFGEVMAQRHNEWSLRASLESIRAGRKHHGATSQQQQIEQLLTRIESQELVSGTGKPLTERTDMTAVTQGLQTIDLLCVKTDQGASVVALLRRCAAPVASLLVTETVTKAVMATLCQTLLNLMKYDSVCVDDVMRQYVQCLRVVRPGLKEAAVNTVLEFLVFADARQRRQILQQLFDDPSEIAKSKLGVYLKSAAFRTTLLVASKT
ncbi:hypothetical protein PC129_g2517 [Phytophthora cactorum]|uniref:Uncharacterized protein n=1 Tax=Phytophthora cactorum TaxID=29920 RepID=A0A329SY48_9STRA|nr:hypothetical protein Pcac1_g10775 [Phytophthora cactorum]KAG2839168.1 hypothetical protein PC112_g4239 [Phytophthora cactorum]KAG2841174.1 hypothetical protein PC111_g3215 [Phytophthora cactorum]KAG2864977.1 hypothetical protein PC113_g4135 [Phytophthora cactorum]KAG2924176.1 hypothetical protein PC114_g4610 [Phytophthora cactorum]